MITSVYVARKTKEQPGPVYAEIQPKVTDAHPEMKINVAYDPVEPPVTEKFEMGDNLAYESWTVGHLRYFKDIPCSESLARQGIMLTSPVLRTGGGAGHIYQSCWKGDSRWVRHLYSRPQMCTSTAN